MLKFVEITHPKDGLLMPWMDLYEASFPPEGRAPVSSFVRLLERKRDGGCANCHIQAVLDDNRFVALMAFDIFDDLCVTYANYLAVDPGERNRGIGSACLAEVIRQTADAGMQAIIFDVEVPEHYEEPVRRDYAGRRIGLYRRHGALLLNGIRCIEQLPNHPPIPVHIMIRPIRPVTPQKAFDIVQKLYDNVTQIGDLELN